MSDNRYRTGEEPREGDVVQLAEDCGTAKAGEVRTAGKIMLWGYGRPPGVFLEPENGAGAPFPSRLNLIARADEPVTFQPGDVFEVLPRTSYYKSHRGRLTVTEARVGGAFARLAKGGTGLFWDNEIKLVHRPLAPDVSATAPLEAFRRDWRAVKPTQREIGGLRLRTETIRAEGENVRVDRVYGPPLLAEQQIDVGSRVRRKVTGLEGTVTQVIEVPKEPAEPARFAVIKFDGPHAGHSDPLHFSSIELTDDYPFTTEEN